ncbi:MAG: chromosome segregation protein SMC, partial [Firmicutes bacterium]|nr:chromosome segregation protein SMC [Bacillota bacterium]
MRLKRLELVGFKSFASRVCLEFGRGITAIVGPNGSGKSNISDAIRWVLGEQSARSLRGSKMEDVIFSGSDGKKPLGMAEVQLTLDNSEGFLPLDFSEVTVTRRVYRSGQSEFLINGRQCRLRDIQDLFTDTGLGKEGYALIGQGQIDAVLSVRSHDRRVVLEETAGIVKYRLRKEEALQKIEQTNQDLVRVTDILRELDQRLGPLHREAEKARRYQILGEKLLLAEQDYYGLELQRLERECAALGEERQSLLETAATVKAKQLRLEETISQLDQDLACLTQDLEAGQARQFELAEQHSSLANAIDVKSERLRNTAERLQALAELCAAKLAQLDTLQAQRRALLAELQRALETCRLTETRIEGADQALRAKQGQRQQLRQELENSQNEFFEFMRSLAELRNFQRSFAKDEQALLRQIEAKEQAAADSAARIEQLKSSAAETDKLRSTKAEQAAQTRQEAEALQKEQRDLQVQAEQQKARLGRIQAQITQLHARLNTLQELDADYEGYTASVRRLMQARSHRELVLGTVADVLKVPPGLELAFEVALGSALQNIITPDEAAAQTLIEWLKSNHAGRATFLPLDAMRPSLFPPNSLKLLRQPGVLGTGLELAEFEERFRPVVASLLGRVVFTEDLDAAVALRRTLQQFSRIVTRDGSVVYPSGAMTGGSQTTRTSGLLSRKQEIHQLQESIAREREAAEAHKQTLGRLEAALTRVDSRLQTIAEEQVASQLGLQRLEQNLEQLQKEIGREKEHHSRLLLEAEQLVQSRETLLAQQETA